MLFLQEVIVISESVIWNLSREEIQERLINVIVYAICLKPLDIKEQVVVWQE